MTIHYDETHQGTLVIELTGDTTVTVEGVEYSQAEHNLHELATGNNTRVDDQVGTMYMIQASAVLAARWEPNR